MKKTILWTDLHFGYKNNNEVFNQDCLDYIDWLIETAKKEGIKQTFFLGDYFHFRSSVNIKTLKYAIEGVRKLSGYFDKVFMILGNHDLYYREKLSVHSLEWLKEYKNVVLVDKPYVHEDATLLPWFVKDEWKSVNRYRTPYLFGHFEIPGFLLNAMVPMPDHGHLQETSFSDKTRYVFSGHFHKRQVKEYENYQIHYMGNCFPHNFSDANDTARGCCIIEDGQEPRYLNWQDAPNYRALRLSDLLDAPEDYINEKTYAKVTTDLPLSFEDQIFIRDTFMKVFGAREINLIPEKKEIENMAELEDITFESVDAIILKALDSVESTTIDKCKLVNLYNIL